MSKIHALAVLVLGSALISAAWSREPPKAAEPGKDALGEVFAKLKGLSGEWEAAQSSAQFTKGQVVVRYRLTGGGTAIAETILPGTDTEMLSVYHRDGAQLVMTHYCCMGNQPRMRAKPGQTKDEVVFEFVGGTNLNPDKDGHIHGGRIRFVDADHLHSEWDYYAKGKLVDKHAFDLVRKK